MRVWRLGLAAVLLGGCLEGGSDIPGSQESPASVCGDLVEDRTVYDQDDRGVAELRITVADTAGLAAVNANTAGAEVDAYVQDGSFAASARLKLRGKSTRKAPQKSYKIELEKGTAWRGLRELNLNKHPYDLTRVRQQLAFELLRSLPHMTSLRTQFVHLYVNGEDLGLYTNVEDPDQRFLAAHGLDLQGALYKAQNFAFFPIADDVLRDPTRREAIIESKAHPDMPKLLRMLAAVNDPTIPIDDVIAAHFDRRNYLNWLAFNLLVGNFDTRSQNFVLYSPSGCETWYFLPWDYDGSEGWYEQPSNVGNGKGRQRWMAGLAGFWGIVLHERFISDPDNVFEIRGAMKRMRESALTDERIAGLLAQYREIVRPYVSRAPDLWTIPVYPKTPVVEERVALWDAEVGRLGGVVGGLQREFAEVEERPMPVWQLSVPMPEGVFFAWSPSYDLRQAGETYDFELASAPTFAEESMSCARPASTPWGRWSRPPRAGPTTGGSSSAPGSSPRTTGRPPSTASSRS